ncbi:MAG: hypothetical protein M1819_001569 [Sarea resinae]|nr:MAG: hypothetical protein M1819_001569 [Sarea resinae]
MRLSFVCSLLALAGLALCATPEEWRSRSIYQVVTDRFALANGSTEAPCNPSQGIYCGGSYNGLIERLDYIQDMGFTAIWISPITYQLTKKTSDLTSYHGYWQQDLYSLNSNFGSDDELRQLADELHSRGMYLMVDIVVNHFAWPGGESSVKYNQFTPFDDDSYFHSYCSVTSETNQTNLDDCWLGDDVVELPDLRTEDPAVASVLNEWIGGLVSNYSVDGLRLDSARNVNQDFFPKFNKAAGVFCIGEVANGDANYTCGYQDSIDSVLNYPLYFVLVRAFQSPTSSISDLSAEMKSVRAACKDPTLLGTFSENHDVPRFPSYTPDISLAKNVIAFTILSEGIPIIYQGQEQHFSGAYNPVNREAVWTAGYNSSGPLYSFIALLNGVRNQAIHMAQNYTIYQSLQIYEDDYTLALRRGFNGTQTILVLSNLGTSGDSYTLHLNGSDFTPGQNLTEILGCTTVLVDSNGAIPIRMEQGLPKVFYPSELLKGSDVCQPQKTLPTPTFTGAPPSLTAVATPTYTGKHKKSAAMGFTDTLSSSLVILSSLFITLWLQSA